MTYRDSLTAAMAALASDPATRFIGYGVKYGRAMGTLKHVPDAQLVETPVAENLMVGAAIGMSLAGLLPVVFIERMDFILNAADAIVNHLDKIALMSRGEFRPAVILRVVVGNRCKPLFTGETHTQDLCEAMQCMLSFDVVRLQAGDNILGAYATAAHRQTSGQSTMLVEYKDFL